MPLPTMCPHRLPFAAFLLLGWVACAPPEHFEIASEDNTVYATPDALAGQSVVSLALVNAQTNEVVLALTPNATLTLSALPTQVAVRAATSPSQVGSVRFDLDGDFNYCTQNAAPYLLDMASATQAIWAAKPGSHTITVTPFSEADLQGTAGRALTISFTLDVNVGTVQSSNTPSGNANGTASQNPNAQNANTVYNPNLPIAHIYDFANGFTDTAPMAAGRINGTLVAATITNDTLVTSLSPSAVGLQLPTQVFAHYTGSFTVEQWFTWAQSAGDYEAIFSISVDTNHSLMAHPKRLDNGLFSVDLRPGNGGTQYSATAPAPAAGSPVFMAVVYDAQAGTMSLYINGTFASLVTVPVAVNLSALSSTAYTGVGGFSPWSDPGFNGSTRRFIVQPKALSSQQVAADFTDPAHAGL